MESYVGCGTSEKLHSGAGQPCIRISDITEMGQLKKVSLACSGDAPILEEGDILFARVGNHMFKSYLYDPADGKLSFASFLIRFHIEKDNPKYIQYYALSSLFRRSSRQAALAVHGTWSGQGSCRRSRCRIPTGLIRMLLWKNWRRFMRAMPLHIKKK